jgi:hypothetical protein
VEGDNTAHSNDSKTAYGPVSAQSTSGPLVWILFVLQLEVNSITNGPPQGWQGWPQLLFSLQYRPMVRLHY